MPPGEQFHVLANQTRELSIAAQARMTQRRTRATVALCATASRHFSTARHGFKRATTDGCALASSTPMRASLFDEDFSRDDKMPYTRHFRLHSLLMKDG